MKYVIAGLGNPTAAHAHTRHNIGFRIVERVAQQLQVSFATQRHGWVAEATHKGKKLLLLKPNTYMNLSGKAVRYYLAHIRGDVSQLLVVVDDLYLPFGTLRLRAKGGHSGHNGLEDISACLQTEQYARLRVGIGHGFPRGAQASYVLSAFDPAEEEALTEHLQKATDMVLSFCTLGIAETMNRYH